jgi:hypothetical protein
VPPYNLPHKRPLETFGTIVFCQGLGTLTADNAAECLLTGIARRWELRNGQF